MRDATRTALSGGTFCAALAVLAISLGCAPTAPSRAAIPKLPAHARVPYGEDPELQSIELHQPPRSGAPAPVVAYVHGGGWSEPFKGGHQIKAAYFNREGFVFALVRHRLAPRVKHPAQVEDVARAIGWLHRNAAQFGGDPNRILLLGHSSGAHLAALAAVAPEHLARNSVPPGAIRALALLDGSGYDLVTRYPGSRGWMRRMLDGAFGSDPEVLRDASPARRIDPGRCPPPMLVFHVGGRPESKDQATALAEAAKRAGGEAEVVEVRDRDHVTLDHRLGTEGDEVAPRILRFFKSRI